MSQEYEFVRYSRLHHIKIFLNEIKYRNYHTHNAFELLFILDGEGRLSLQTGSIELRKGSIVLINPYEPHEIQAAEGAVLGLFLQVSRHFCRDYFPYFSSITFANKPFSNDAKLIKEKMLEIALCYLEAKPLFEMELVSLVSGFLCGLMKEFDFCIMDEHNHSIREKRIQRMKRIAAYINDHYTEPVRLAEIAEMEQLTTTHISHLFKDYYGISFQDYLNNLRFEKAMTMILNTRLSQTEIAIAGGFSDAKYLSGIIRKRLGCSLSEYRSKMASNDGLISENDAKNLLEYKYTDEEGIKMLKKLGLI